MSPKHRRAILELLGLRVPASLFVQGKGQADGEGEEKGLSLSTTPELGDRKHSQPKMVGGREPGPLIPVASFP